VSEREEAKEKEKKRDMKMCKEHLECVCVCVYVRRIKNGKIFTKNHRESFLFSSLSECLSKYLPGYNIVCQFFACDWNSKLMFPLFLSPFILHQNSPQFNNYVTHQSTEAREGWRNHIKIISSMRKICLAKRGEKERESESDSTDARVKLFLGA
jgi:hypothetical protein